MRLTGTVTIVNSLVQYQRYGAYSKLEGPCNGVLQIRKRGDGDGRDILSVTISSIGNGDGEALDFDVQKIIGLRTVYASEGISQATIEILQPPRNLMLRDCQPEELSAFLDELHSLSTRKNLMVSSASTNGQDEVSQTENQKSLGSFRKGQTTKRARSPELRRTEKNKRRTLPLSPASSQTIRVKDRASYPRKKILPTIERIYVQGIGLQIIDRRFLKLQWLQTLDLSENSIEKIDRLANLSSNLKSLILDKNQIAYIPDDLFNAPALQKLQHLDLSGNQLSKFPSSILNVETLASLYISGNKISYLPYNWTGVQNLRVLNFADNHLKFIPATLLYIHMNSLDVSGNPDLQRTADNLDLGYVDLSFVPKPIPTLFQMACEVVKNRVRPSEYGGSLPSVIQGYLQAEKYCVECGKKTLKYKVTQGSVMPSSFNRKSRPACEVYPKLESCLIKKIICNSCDSKFGNSGSRFI